MTKRDDVGETGQMRNFGLIMAAACALIAVWPTLSRAQPPRAWVLVVSGLWVLLALAAPTRLRPLWRMWMRFGTALNWINTRIILGFIFFGLLTPLALVMRRIGRDPFRRQFEPGVDTYRLKRTPRPSSHLRLPF